MHIEMNAQALARTLRAAKRFAMRKPPHPVYGCARLRERGGRLVVVTTDLEAYARLETGATAPAGFDVAVDVKAVLAALKGVKRGVRVSLEPTDGGLVVTVGEARRTLTTHHVEGYPDVPTAPDGHPGMVDTTTGEILLPPTGGVATANGPEFRLALSRGLACAARERMRYALNGVLLETGAGIGLHVTATDGRRLSHDVVPATCDAGLKFIAGRDALKAALPLLKGADVVELRWEKHEPWIWIKIDDVGTVIVRQVEGTFPGYRDVIPDTTPVEVTLAPQSLMDALRAAIPATSREARSVRLTFGDDGPMTVVARSSENGSYSGEVPISSRFGSGEFGFNPEYLADMLAGADGAESVTIGLQKASPAILRMGSWEHVLMPVSLD